VSGPIARRAANAGLILVSAVPTLLIVNLAYEQYRNRDRPPPGRPPAIVSVSCALRVPPSPRGTLVSLRPSPPRIVDERCP
jgi:hypothetical protein